MSNYTLTTNLIADCMALIPQNLERLNESNLELQTQGKDSFMTKVFENGKIGFYFDHEDGWQDLLSEYFRDCEKVYIISHCLRTIPEFQKTNFLYQDELQEFDSYMRFRLKANDNEGGEWAKLYVKNLPKTIASATLHGQGEYPPSTLEELCKSYKNVMSK